jgi:hypothetical protein
MKLDNALLLNILESVESSCDGAKPYKMNGDPNSDPVYAKKIYHAKLLLDNGLVKGCESQSLGYILPTSISINYLTLNGQKLLETMRSSSWLEQAKSGALQTLLSKAPSIVIDSICNGTLQQLFNSIVQ